MINLLPETEKKALRREYHLRLLGVWLVLASLAVAIGTVSLLPAFFLSQVQEAALEADVSLLEQRVKSASTDDLSVLLKSTNDKLTVLADTRSTGTLAELLTAIVTARPTGVVLTGFNITYGEKGKGKLSIEGVAPRRTALSSFVKELEGTKRFTSVTFPVANLTQSVNIDFSLTATGDF